MVRFSLRLLEKTLATSLQLVNMLPIFVYLSILLELYFDFVTTFRLLLAYSMIGSSGSITTSAKKLLQVICSSQDTDPKLSRSSMTFG